MQQSPSSTPTPMPLFTLIRGALNLLRRYSSLFMGLAALQVVPLLIGTLWMQANGVQARATSQLNVIMAEMTRRVENNQMGDGMWVLEYPRADIAPYIWGLLGVGFFSIFIMRNVAMAASVIAVGEHYRQAKPRWLNVVLSSLRHLPSLFAWGCLCVLALFIALFFALAQLPGLVLGLGLLWFFGVRLSLVPQIIVAERINVFRAIHHSWVLTKGAFGRISNIWITLVVLLGVLASYVTTIISAIAMALFGETSALTIALTQGLSTVTSIMTLPMAYIGFTLLYYDQIRLAYAGVPNNPSLNVQQ
ncbi:hypothetical protein [Herpetosiphon geysericola]|nr:hypothetical protein [Herpetosiphon geysericola]